MRPYGKIGNKKEEPNAVREAMGRTFDSVSASLGQIKDAKDAKDKKAADAEYLEQLSKGKAAAGGK